MLSQWMTERTALVAVTLLGMALCSRGIGQIAANNGWLHPIAFLGYAFGVLILIIVGATLLGFSLPWIDSTRTALLAIILIAVTKIVLAQVYRFAH